MLVTVHSHACRLASRFLLLISLTLGGVTEASGQQSTGVPPRVARPSAKSAAAASDSAARDSAQRQSVGVPLSPFIDTIFFVRTRLGSFGPEARAEAISARVRKLAAAPFFSSDSLRQDSTDTSVDLVYGDLIVLSVTSADARLEGTDQRALATRYQTAIASSIQARRQRTSFTQIATNVALASLVLLVLAAIIALVSKVFRRSHALIRSQKGQRITGFRVRNYEIFSADRSVHALLLANSALKWLVVAIAVYLAFPVLFGIFPWTRGLAETLLGYVLSPLRKSGAAIWNYIPSLFTIAVIVWIFRTALRGLAFFRDEIKRGSLTLSGFYPDWAEPTFQILRVLTYAF
ncbi:MAG: hypothetical protein ABI120_11970, partial [Gemmatimonadaceae bacterium]